MPTPDGCVATEKVIAKLRELGYSFKRQADRVCFYRKGTHMVPIQRKDFLHETTVRQILTNCDVSNEEANRFIAACRA